MSPSCYLPYLSFFDDIVRPLPFGCLGDLFECGVGQFDSLLVSISRGVFECFDCRSAPGVPPPLSVSSRYLLVLEMFLASDIESMLEVSRGLVQRCGGGCYESTTRIARLERLLL
jgi:hypothetical protein